MTIVSPHDLRMKKHLLIEHMQTAYTRREMLKTVALTSIVSFFPHLASAALGENFSSQRPPQSRRNFTSRAVEQSIRTVKAKVADPELAWMFENCYPNTLDTTVRTGTADGMPDTFVITGDINAMWLRDSSCQVWPYLELAKGDTDHRLLFRGLIARQVRCILLDPFRRAGGEIEQGTSMDTQERVIALRGILGNDAQF